MKKVSISDLAMLSQLTRWQNVPTIRSESVATHICQVALIVMKLYCEEDIPEFDLGHALKLAILHDVLECWTTDLPHNVTQRFPLLAKAKAEAEAELSRAMLPEWQELLDELDKQMSVEAKIVKLADAMQVMQFASSELELSSSNTRMQDVLAEASTLVEAKRAELPPYKHTQVGVE